jgi:hypothetical protein
MDSQTERILRSVAKRETDSRNCLAAGSLSGGWFVWIKAAAQGNSSGTGS